MSEDNNILPPKGPEENRVNVTLLDMGEGKDEQEVLIRYGPQGIYLYPKGYGEKDALDSAGSPVFLELFDGQLRVVVSDDINDSDNIILPLDEAQESLRGENTDITTSLPGNSYD